MSLDSILNISITNTTVSVTQQGFGVPLILGYHTRFTDRFREYSTLAAMVSDGFTATDMEYRAASKVFSQNPRPTSVIVGRRLTKSTRTVTVTPVAVHGATYTVTINGTDFSYPADSATSVQEIVEGLTAAINGGSEPVTAAEDDTTMTLTGDTYAQFTLSVSATNGASMALQDTTTDAGWATDLADLLAASKDWYAVIMTSKGAAEIAAAAAWVEANQRLLIASTFDADCLTSATTDVASDLQDAAYARTSLMWHQDPYSFPEAAWFGKLLPETPGSATWEYKTLAGITVTPTTTGFLTDTAIGHLESKNASFYVELGGVNVTRNSKVAADEWLDIVIGLDWLKARMQERIYSRLVGLKKIPFTAVGIAVIEAEIRAQIQEGVRAGLLVGGSETISFPDIAAISAQDKAARLLPDGVFTATLAGAIHAADIAGSVSV